MSVLTMTGVSIRFAETTLLEGVNLSIERGDRWGIVGRNGAGKTSLFQLITGRLTAASGSVTISSGTRVAVLDQHREVMPAATVWDVAAGAFQELLELERRLAEMTDEMGRAGDQADPALFDEYSHALERFEREGGYAVSARVDAVLHGLGFDPVKSRHQLAGTLSGGERGRLALARQLATGADLLLLDEPTNHLDLETTAWLEDYLASLDATVLVVSHDRAFLQAAVNHILHLENRAAVAYEGDYRSFVEQRTLRRLTQQRSFQKQARAIAKEEDYIRRNIAGQNSAQAKGRQRRLGRLPRLSEPEEDVTQLLLRFDAGARGGDQVLVADDVSVTIGDRVLLDGFSATVRRGDIVGLVGANGMGKSTLLSVLLGDGAPAAGTVRIGDSVRVGYYRQDLGEVPRDQTLFDIIHDLRPSWTRGQVQDHLGRFGFSGDSVRRRAESLSGGELARVALAILVLSGANLLVFDEPTNHLDVESIEALEDAIEAFEGTVILVSHDRALLRTLTERTWMLRDQVIEDFPGGFEEWEAVEAERRSAEARLASEAAGAARARKRTDDERGRSQGPSVETKLKRELAQVEDQIHTAEAELTKLERELHDDGLYGSAQGARRAADLGKAVERAKQHLEAVMTRWEAISLELESQSGGSNLSAPKARQ